MATRPRTSRRRGPKATFGGEKGMRLVRLWRTLLAVIEAERPLSVPEINERVTLDHDLDQYAGNIPTTRDDLWLLVRTGFPLLVTTGEGEEIDTEDYLRGDQARRGRYKNLRWSLRHGGDIGRLSSSRHRRPTSAELTTLSLLRALLRDEVPRDYPLYQQLQNLVDGLHGWFVGHLKGEDRDRLVDRFVKGSRRTLVDPPPVAILNAAAEALRRDKVLEGVYTHGNGYTGPVLLLPVTLARHEGRAYLFAVKVKQGQPRLYRLDRFESLQVRADIQKPEYDTAAVDRLLQARFGGYIAPPQRVRLRVAQEIAYLFREFQYHASQKVRSRRDGSLTVVLECAVSWELEEWILGFGEFAEVLEPDTLRARIAGRHNAAAEKYKINPKVP